MDIKKEASEKIPPVSGSVVIPKKKDNSVILGSRKEEEEEFPSKGNREESSLFLSESVKTDVLGISKSLGSETSLVYSEEYTEETKKSEVEKDSSSSSCFSTNNNASSQLHKRRNVKEKTIFDPDSYNNTKPINNSKSSGMLSLATALKRCKGVENNQTIPSIPVINLSEQDELIDPIVFLEKYKDIGMKHGAVKVIPPKNEWNPPFELNLKDIRFEIREQRIDLLTQGAPFKHPITEWSVQEFQGRNAQVAKSIFDKEDISDLPIDQIEEQYWNILMSNNSTPEKKQKYEIEVGYAADLRTDLVGSGFPKKDSSSSSLYSSHSWNLLNLPTTNGSMLKEYHLDIPGVTSPWLYLGMLYSTFCWHTEDNYFASVNYQHIGAPKVWYFVPPHKASLMEKLIRSYTKNGCRDSDAESLHSLTTQIPPSVLIQNNIPVYRVVQNPGEFIVLWPRCFHGGFNSGFNCNEACNIAPGFWFEWGYKAVQSYKYIRPFCIPHDELVILNSVYYKSHTLPRICHILKAFYGLLTEQFELLSESKLPQYPMLLSKERYEVLVSGVYSNTLKVHQKSLLAITNSDPHKTLAGLTSYYKKDDHDNNNHEDNNHDEYDHHILSLSRLPWKECDNCQTPCYLGNVVCPHATDVMCLSCEEAHPCQCEFRIILYRFPISKLATLLETVKSYYCTQRNGILNVSLEKTKKVSPNEDNNDNDNDNGIINKSDNTTNTSIIRGRRKKRGRSATPKKTPDPPQLRDCPSLLVWDIPGYNVMSSLENVTGLYQLKKALLPHDHELSDTNNIDYSIEQARKPPRRPPGRPRKSCNSLAVQKRSPGRPRKNNISSKPITFDNSNNNSNNETTASGDDEYNISNHNTGGREGEEEEEEEEEHNARPTAFVTHMLSKHQNPSLKQQSKYIHHLNGLAAIPGVPKLTPDVLDGAEGLANLLRPLSSSNGAAENNKSQEELLWFIDCLTCRVLQVLSHDEEKDMQKSKLPMFKSVKPAQ